MNHTDAIELIEELDGDEHSWVDYKSDYYVDGNPHLKVEFLKDVLALANATHDEVERYILIGCDEEEGIVGVSEDASEESEDERHILEFDEDDLQEKVDGWMTPSPRLELHTYDEGGDTFSILVVNEPDNPPSISTTHISNNGDNLIEEGEIWVRGSSGKHRVTHETLENIIQKRITDEREFILEGVRRVVGMGPDAVADIGKLQPSEKAEADITFEISPEGDYEVSGDVFRRNFGSLQEEIDADVAKSRVTSGYSVDLQTLMRYYANVESLDDAEVAELLTHSSLTEWLQGTYWMQNITPDTRKEILEGTPDNSAARHSACKNLLISGEKDTFDEFISNSESINYPKFNVSKYRRLFDRGKQSRVEEILTNQSPVTVDGEEIDTRDEIDAESAREFIPKIAEKWLEASDDSQKKDYKYTLRNLELWLALDLL